MEPAVRTSTGPGRVVTVVLDVPGKPVNVCTPQLLAELSAVVDTLAASKPAGVIVSSAKARSFNAGADLFAIRDMTPEQAGSYLAQGQALFERIRALPFPTVAAINGDCLGGGMELALACRYRVAADDGSINLGLPEVTLGLIPAWGGATRLPRMIGLAKALPILLAGKTMPPREALECGLVDEIVPRDGLLAAAAKLLSNHPRPRRPGLAQRLSAGLSPARNRILAAARRRTVERTFDNDPAPLRLLDVVKTGYEHGPAVGLMAERETILQLTQTEATRNLLRLFFLRQGAKRRAAGRLKAKAADVHDAAIIAGGTTGAEIAHALARAGVRVCLVQPHATAASAADAHIRTLLDQDVSAGRLDEPGARDVLSLVSSKGEWTELSRADVVIETLAETLESKRDVLARVEKITRPDAVLATNSGSLRVAEIAQAVSLRARVIGLHFIDPVSKTPLVEVVRGPESDDASLATGVALVTRIGRTPLLVADRPGFLVNRMLTPYLLEALAVAAEGVPVAKIDEAMKRWGMAAGPFELLEERKALNDELARLTTPDRHQTNAGRASLSHEGIQWRLVLSMANEAARALGEGVTDSADDIDLASVLALGFAPFRGGLAKFVEDVGTVDIVRRLAEHEAQLGPRFAPAELLQSLSRDGNRFLRPDAGTRPGTTARSKPPAAHP